MRPRLLDLFCGAGGASMGYRRAGFEVVGVDLRAQPRYPFEFHRGDALAFPLEGFDFIHASPPCQAFSQRGMAWKREHPDLIAAVRERIVAARVPFVIENVPRAPLREPGLLCGQAFGLGVLRHRHFEVSFPVPWPEHRRHVGHVGDGTLFTVTGHSGGHGVKKSGSRKVDGGVGAAWRTAMGIDWMTNAELVQAIPPAYTEFIGGVFLAEMRLWPSLIRMTPLTDVRVS